MNRTPFKRLVQTCRECAALIVLLVMVGLPAIPSALGAYQQGITPGSLEAYLFTTYPNMVSGTVPSGHFQELAGLLTEQGYNVHVREDYNGPGNDFPGTATAGEFKRLAGAGIVILWVHGNPDGLAVEEYQTADVRDKAIELYLSTAEFKPGELEPCTSGDAPNFFPSICITAAAIQALWAGKNRDALVFAGACDSAGLADEIGVRDYFGYSCPVLGTDVLSDSRTLFGRMSGGLANGDLRTAEEAFNGGSGYSAGLALTQASPVPILLAPGVWNHLPTADLPSPTDGTPIEYGAVMTFDAAMDTTKVPVRVVSRCAEYAPDVGWDALGHHFSFKIRVKATPAADFIRIESMPDAAQSHNIHQALDGNQIPPASNRVGPAGDPFEWALQCLPTAPCEGEGCSDAVGTVGGFILATDLDRGTPVRAQTLALLPFLTAVGLAVWLRHRRSP